MKNVSLVWALLVGLLTVVIQIVTFYVRFGRLNAAAALTEYLLVFVAGALGGSILILFLNRQATTTRRWLVLAAFVLVSPIAIIMMIGGGLLGPLGVLIFPQIPWLLAVWLAALVGSLVSNQQS